MLLMPRCLISARGSQDHQFLGLHLTRGDSSALFLLVDKDPSAHTGVQGRQDRTSVGLWTRVPFAPPPQGKQDL